MEAPEKIYLYTEGNTLDNDWLYEAPKEFTSFEYIRTDAFIKKAMKFIRDNVELSKYTYDYFETNMFLEDFKKYMEE